MSNQYGTRALGLMLVGIAAVVTACSDSAPTELTVIPRAESKVQAFSCTANIRAAVVSCGEINTAPGVQPVLIGGQNQNVALYADPDSISYDPGTEIFRFPVTITNLMNEAIGTPDGTIADPNGIRVFFHSGPTATDGSGSISVLNADGTSTFTAADQPYFQYDQILAHNQTSNTKTWELLVPATVNTFSFRVFLETEVQPLLVINEVLVNPGGTILDANGEWFELHNAGSRAVDLHNFLIADSAASGRRPYHLITSSVVIPAGGYAVLGNTTNTTNNGGVTVDYAYGAALQLANSLDAIKIARLFGTDTLTIDRTQYSSPGVSAQNGISRELKNPALDNGNMDGSNWADALVTAVYGPGGRGTPKAQNSTFEN